MTSETNEPNDSGQLPWEAVFIENMKLLREKNAISQTELARLLADRGLPFHQQTVQRTETGVRPVRLNEAAVIAEVLGANLSVMLQTHSADEQWLFELGRRLSYYVTRTEPILKEGIDLIHSIDRALAPFPQEDAEQFRELIPIEGLREVLKNALHGLAVQQRIMSEQSFSSGAAQASLLPELESVVCDLPSVAEAVGLVRESPTGGPMLVMFVVPKQDAGYSVEAVRDALMKTAKQIHVPLALVTLEEIPRYRNGKLNAKMLREFNLMKGPRTGDRRSLIFDPWIKTRK
ncbi:AMP-binding enzyme [Nocardia sp. CA-290969]|uniref:AMP-binding enzyme n=1 Tax=Nocardia sp. CA-290969 TaxID=3239986 RepID=UPI003D943C87